MVQYADYHRDRRNIATHFVGIPMIVFAIGVLLARRPAVAAWRDAGVGGLRLVALWYLTRGNLALGLATSAGRVLLIALALDSRRRQYGHWLAWGVGPSCVGWVIQFVGHYYEGRKPAFVDDLVGLLVGPMFVVAEALFALGWGKDLLAEIERGAGPTHLRDLDAPAAR